MARKTSIFDRAAKALENGSAAEVKAAIDELNELTAKEQPQRDAVRPPGQQIHDGAGRLCATLPTGKKLEAALVAEDDCAIAECRDQFERLTARLNKAAGLRVLMKQRLPILEAEEAIAGAPAKAKAAVAALDNLLDEHAASIEHFNDVHARLKATTADLLAARKLDPSAPSVTLAQFHRIGCALGYLPPTRRQESEGGYSTPARVTTPLFGHSPTAVANARTLVDVPKSIVKRTRELLGMRTSAGRGLDANYTPNTSDAAVRSRLNEWYTEVVRLLSRDDLDTAKNLGPPEHRPGGKGKPVFPDEAA